MVKFKTWLEVIKYFTNVSTMTKFFPFFVCELVHLIAVIPNSDVGVAPRLDDGVAAS